jgi:hypothetical protein
MAIAGPSLSPRPVRLKRSVELIATLLPFLTVVFVWCEYSGVWDRLQGLDAVEKVAQRFDLSYARASLPS